MARTKTRRRTRTSRGRSRTRRTSFKLPDLARAWNLLVRPEVVGTALVVLATAALAYLVPPLSGLVPEARDRVVEALGLHAFTATLLVAALGVLLALRRAHWLGRQARHIAGFLALLVFAAGLLGRWYPTVVVGTVNFGVHSAGGDSGRWLAGVPWGLLAWTGSLLAGFVLLWPQTAAQLARSAPAAVGEGVAWLWASGPHRHVGRWLARSGEQTRAVAARVVSRASREDAPAGIVQTPRRPAPALAAPTPPAATVEVDEEADAGEEDEAREARNVRRRRRVAQLSMDMNTPPGELRHSADGWQLPPIGLLAPDEPNKASALDNERRARLIVETLASFGVDASVVQINEGPTVTQFGVEPGWDVKTKSVVERDANGQPVLGPDGQPKTKEVEVSRTRIRVNRITALQNDLALALAAPALRIEAPVPGKPMVGIEVPNQTTSIVSLRRIMESPAFQKGTRQGGIPIALGAGVSGDPIVADLATMPHVLIAGATGSGKSVCLNAFITCMLMNFSPEELRLVMIDPKRVELTGFANIPHLAFSDIVVDMDRVVATLQAVINEMESRYRRFARAGVRNIKRYNEKTKSNRMPYWVVIIDELADLMLVAPYQVENQLVRLAQLARATGIHLVVATQRPSVDVITGLIKANFPTRIAFAVSSQVDSRTILDRAGAEKLLGRGDMLYVPPDAQNPKRVQGVFASDQEIDSVVRFWTDGRFEDLVPAKYDDLLQDAERQVEQMTDEGLTADDDPMLHRAIELAREHKSVSTSMLQRRLRIGYPRAARLMEDLESRGIVGEGEGNASREVLVAAEPGAGPESLAAAAASWEPPAREEPPPPPPGDAVQRDATQRDAAQRDPAPRDPAPRDAVQRRPAFPRPFDAE